MDTSKLRFHTDYMMDMENEALESWSREIITGRKRAFNKEWVNHIGRYLDLCGNIHRFYTEDEWKLIRIHEYRLWVLQGGGDEWFQEE
tara:strand:+ start:2009 stop:2272 length:264 start_codon:yes stop_codon:yes gene_type:complete